MMGAGIESLRSSAEKGAERFLTFFRCNPAAFSDIKGYLAARYALKGCAAPDAFKFKMKVSRVRWC